jgi:distribution and morphology protein 10
VSRGATSTGYCLMRRAVSTGMRFTTIPPASPLPPNAPPPSPPTTLTLLYNPLIGFLSSAYAAQVSPTIALSTRFGVNVYSYESDLCVGGEWWVGRRRGKQDTDSSLAPEGPRLEGERLGRDALLSEASLRSDEVADSRAERQLDSPIPLSKGIEKPQSPPVAQGIREDRDGVIKVRLSGNWVSSRSCMERSRRS